MTWKGHLGNNREGRILFSWCEIRVSSLAWIETGVPSCRAQKADIFEGKMMSIPQKSPPDRLLFPKGPFTFPHCDRICPPSNHLLPPYLTPGRIGKQLFRLEIGREGHVGLYPIGTMENNCGKIFMLSFSVNEFDQMAKSKACSREDA
jgi:hypothetical protein